MSDHAGPARPGRRWTRGELVIVVAGVLLAADLVTLPWHHYRLDVQDLGLDLPSFNLERTGVQSPQAAFGIIAVGIALGMAVHVVLAKFVPAVPRLEQVHLVAGAVVLGLVLAKLLADREFLGTGAWVGTALAFTVAYGGFALSQESDAPT
ncbi:MAG TPA: hypothetical protein VHF27_10275 [Acidimicrobiales bacterium]|nr:hypothetical protein [Acidimicrobiales bacterium]